VENAQKKAATTSSPRWMMVQIRMVHDEEATSAKSCRYIYLLQAGSACHRPAWR
jgi:hypothetical protein